MYAAVRHWKQPGCLKFTFDSLYIQACGVSESTLLLRTFANDILKLYFADIARLPL